jgi:hypothetical protein
MTVSAVSAVNAVGVAGARGAGGVLGAAGGVPRTVVRRTGFTITADGAYAACLAEIVGDGGGVTGSPGGSPTGGAGGSGGGSPTGGSGGVTEGVPDGLPDGVPGGSPEAGSGTAGGLLAERWTLSGPEPYAVPLPGPQPEEPGTQVLPLADGRVLIRRRVADRYDLALLYPSGPDTGELPVGSLTGDDVRLLPPAPTAAPVAYALAYEAQACRTDIWRVHGAAAPELVMTVPGRCTGGVWLDRAGRLLALDRELAGRTKAVAADLHTGRTSPLLQITDDSDDRLLLAEPDSGLLLLRSDAPGESRLGWGVLGSHRPVRFPDALRVPGVQLTPVAAQPGQILTPEASVIAFRAEVPGGAESLALWRPGDRRLHWRASPLGWLGAAGMWLPGDELRLPYASGSAGQPARTEGDFTCGLAAYEPPATWPERTPVRSAGAPAWSSAGSYGAGSYAPGAGASSYPPGAGTGPYAASAGAGSYAPGAGDRMVSRPGAAAGERVRAALPAGRAVRRALTVLPLQQAPLAAAPAI